MKFTILNKIFIKLLRKTNVLLTRNALYPILENVLLETKDNKLFLTSTNTEIEIQTFTSDITILKTGSTTVSGKKILDICRRLSNDYYLDIEYSKNKFKIISKSSQYLLATLSNDYFPNFKISEHDIHFSISQNNLKDILYATHFSMAVQDIRYFLNGMLFEIKNKNLYAVTTDGYRLSICKTPLNSFSKDYYYSTILPRKSVLELIKLLNTSNEIISVKISNTCFRINMKNVTFTSKIIPEKYPDYNTILINSSNKKIVLNIILFKEALSRIAIISNEQFRGVCLQNTTNQLKISTNNQHDEEAFEILDIIYTNITIKTSINASYIIDILNVIKGHEICLLITDSKSSIKIQSNDHNVLPKSIYIIMPLEN